MFIYPKESLESERALDWRKEQLERGEILFFSQNRYATQTIIKGKIYNFFVSQPVLLPFCNKTRMLIEVYLLQEMQLMSLFLWNISTQMSLLFYENKVLKSIRNQ